MWELIIKGQWFMIPLLACSVLAMAVILERFLALRAQRREAGAFLAEFDRLIKARNLDGAVKALLRTDASDECQVSTRAAAQGI